MHNEALHDQSDTSAALTARTYRGRQRGLAYGSLGGVSGASAALGPLIGSWMTANFSRGYVFTGEQKEGLSPADMDAITGQYADAKIMALKIPLAMIALSSLMAPW